MPWIWREQPVVGAVTPGARRVRVRVPATSANLGPGYDSFGLALGIHDRVTAARTEGDLRVRVTGVGADTLPTDEGHLVVRAARAAFQEMDEPMPGLALECANAIPHGSGQGSSAAAIVAGILLARGLTPDGTVRLPDDAVLALATRMEGHPDNVAPALFGGFTVAWCPVHPVPPARRGDGRDRPEAPLPRAVRLRTHPDLRVLLFATDRACPTGTARAALPDLVPHADAAANAARAGLLVHALTTEPDLLFEATEDRLHQSYRAGVMPESADLLHRLRGAGIAAVLSGAGPSVLALGRSLPDPETLSGSGFRARQVTVAADGARVETVP